MRETQHRLLFSLHSTFTLYQTPLSEQVSAVWHIAFLISVFFSEITLAFCKTKVWRSTLGSLDPGNLNSLSMITFAKVEQNIWISPFRLYLTGDYYFLRQNGHFFSHHSKLLDHSSHTSVFQLPRTLSDCPLVSLAALHFKSGHCNGRYKTVF